MSRLENFPPVYWMTLHDSVERHEYMKAQFENYGITNTTVRIHGGGQGVDGRGKDLKNHPNISGDYFGQMSSQEIAVAVGHIEMIKYWLDNSTSDTAMFFEDDVNLENCKNWSFNWSQVTPLLPLGWEAIQFCRIRPDPIQNVNLRDRNNKDWSVTAYMLKRDYAKRILSEYVNGDHTRLWLSGDPKAIPIVENLIYFPAEPNVYTFPIFTEKNTFSSNFLHGVKEHNAASEASVTAWWEENGSKTSIYELMNHAADPIPMIGTAVVTNTHWVKRLVESVDYPVTNFLIINNNGRGEIDAVLDAIAATPHPYISKIKVVHMPSNLGVPSSWNLMIKSYMNCPYWIIVNDDVAFGSGFLSEMYLATTRDPVAGIVHGFAGDHNIGSWDLFLIRDHIIQAYGLFDENLYPAYNEDADYFLRFIHRPIRRIMSLQSEYYHGLGKKNEYHKHGSQTGKSDPILQDKLNRVNLRNIDYMTSKWGPTWRYCAPSKQPFENQPLSATTYDLEFVRSKNLGF